MAQHVGMSMGTVQHYFADREAMLDFVLDYVQQQRTARIERAVQALATPTPAAILDALADEILTADETNQVFERVNAMFLDRARRHPATAERLGQGRAEVIRLFTGLLDGSGLNGRTEPVQAAGVLWALLESLPTAITLGQHTSLSARTVVHRHLASITKETVR
ncbi:TetR family transcriptional regulator [Luteococcus japonicus]|uniref:TetR family transcriptional regulator n=1 Tax=Luteococcus japonicus TaxID=33984 RepID=A0A3N1ZPU6_9ACTN|nr:TetR/AcrR family transcriptional regulator [Luteococcus japonicus]ROR52934.1 TetR family transcriptional regulator [Luteococcus japonicus]